MIDRPIRYHPSERQQILPENRKCLIPWWYTIIGIDFFLVLLSVVGKYLPASWCKSFIVRPFNLAVEMNLAVWWSGVSLAAIGILAFELFTSSKEDVTKKAWLVLSILMLGLSLDEVGSLHERVGGWSEILPYAVICCLMFLYSVYILIRSRQTRKSAVLIIIAFALYGSVAFQEYLEHLLNWPDWTKGLRLGVEEGTELLGTFVLFCSIAPQRNFQINTMRVVIPRPYLTPYLPKFILIGLCLNVASALFFPALMNPSSKGQPLAWYPMILFFILSCTSFWMSLECRDNKRVWSCLSVFFILCSADIMWNLLSFFPIIRSILPTKFISYLLYIIPFFIISIWLLRQKAVALKAIMLTLLFPGLVLVISLLYFSKMNGIPFGIWVLFSSCYGFFLFHLVEKIRDISSCLSADLN